MAFQEQSPGFVKESNKSRFAWVYGHRGPWPSFRVFSCWCNDHCLRQGDSFDKNMFLHWWKQLLSFITLSSILMCTRSTVTNNTKTNTCLILGAENPFDCTEIWFCLFLKKFNALLDDLFSFELGEALKEVMLFLWCAISKSQVCVKLINKLYWSQRTMHNAHSTIMHTLRDQQFRFVILKQLEKFSSYKPSHAKIWQFESQWQLSHNSFLSNSVITSKQNSFQ